MGYGNLFLLYDLTKLESWKWAHFYVTHLCSILLNEFNSISYIYEISEICTTLDVNQVTEVVYW